MSTTTLYETTPQTGTVSSTNLTSLYSNTGNFTTGVVNSAVYSVNGSTGVTVNPTTGNVVVSIGQDVATTANVSFANVTATGNLSNNYFTLANSVGTSGQVLTTNGAGTTSWTTLNAGVTSVTGSGHITASPTSGAVIVGSDATSANTFSTIVARDSAGGFSSGSITIADDKVIYASHGTYGPPDGTFTNVRIGLYGTDPDYAIGVENQHSWIQGNNGVKLYSNDNIPRLIANKSGVKINNAFLLPTADGTSGQVITTNGSGVSSWTSVSGLGLVNSVSGSGAGINVSPTTGAVVVSNTGVTSIVAGTNITVSAATGAVTVNATDTNTTYNIDATATTGGANLNLNGSDSTTDSVAFKGSGSTTVTRTDANTITISSSAGSGDVVGPSSATAQAVAIYNGTTGKLIKNSTVTIADTTGNIVTNGDIAVNGGDITTSSTTGTVFNTTATTVNIGGAATTVAIGASTGTTNINNNLTADSLSLTDASFGNAQMTRGMWAKGTLNGVTYTNGIVVDYTTGTGRISVGTGAGITLYNGGVANTALLAIDTSGNATFKGNITLNGSTSGSITLSAGATPAAQTYTLPTAYPASSGYVLSSTTGGVLSWTAAAGAGVTSITGTTNQIIASASTGAVTLSTPQDIATTSNVNFGSVTTTGDIAVNGGDITTTSTTASLFNTTATTINIGNAASNINLDASITNVNRLDIDNRTTTDTATLTTTSTATVNLTSSTRNVTSALIYIVQGTNVHTVNATVLRVDATTALLTTYGEMYNNIPLANFTGDVSGGNLRILVTPTSATSTLFTAVRTSLS